MNHDALPPLSPYRDHINIQGDTKAGIRHGESKKRWCAWRNL